MTDEEMELIGELDRRLNELILYAVKRALDYDKEGNQKAMREMAAIVAQNFDCCMILKRLMERVLGADWERQVKEK
jgi:hypothetical protein